MSVSAKNMLGLATFIALSAGILSRMAIEVSRATDSIESVTPFAGLFAGFVIVIVIMRN